MLPQPTNPNFSGDLQSRFPGNYARLTSPPPFIQAVPDTFRAFKTLRQSASITPASDYDLANLDDTLKRGGSLLIASLATLGMKQRVFGIGEFLGFASWFGAMAITPVIINGMVRLKTGVNLNQLYDTSYGRRERVFKDPNYLPLHVLSDTVINRAADRLGIPAYAPNRRQLTEEKMRQISVQASTWWMLVAGPATPVISGLVCDQLQNPATRLLNDMKLLWAKRAVAGSRTQPEKLALHTENYLAQLVGERPESTLTSWWKDFGNGISRRTGLGKALAIRDVVDASSEIKIQRLTRYFSELKPGDPAVKETLNYLKSQREYLQALEKRAQDFIRQYDDGLPSQAILKQQRLLETRLGNAMSTVGHYQRLFEKIAQGTLNPTEARTLLEKPALAEVQRLITSGFEQEAKRLTGGSAMFHKVREALNSRQYGRAASLMGASPGDHLLTALKDSKLRRLWQRRIILGLGGGLLLATALFNLFVVGRDFDARKQGGGRR